MLTPENFQLLQFVRRTIAAELGICPEPEPPDMELLHQRRGCFVELTACDGSPRGCVGNVEPFETLGEALHRHALNAAFLDPAFAPLDPEELDETNIAILLPGEPMEITPSGAIRFDADGVMLRGEGRQAVLLPHHARAMRWSAQEAISFLERKAMLPPGAWRAKNSEIFIFSVEHIAEKP